MIISRNVSALQQKLGFDSLAFHLRKFTDVKWITLTELEMLQIDSTHNLCTAAWNIINSSAKKLSIDK